MALWSCPTLQKWFRDHSFEEHGLHGSAFFHYDDDHTNANAFFFSFHPNGPIFMHFQYTIKCHCPTYADCDFPDYESFYKTFEIKLDADLEPIFAALNTMPLKQ